MAHGKSALWLVLQHRGTGAALLPSEGRSCWQGGYGGAGTFPSRRWLVTRPGDKDNPQLWGTAGRRERGVQGMGSSSHGHPKGAQQELRRERGQPEHLHGRELLSEGDEGRNRGYKMLGIVPRGLVGDQLLCCFFPILLCTFHSHFRGRGQYVDQGAELAGG